MIDDQVDTEEIAENRRLRQAGLEATDDGMPPAPEAKSVTSVQIRYKAPRRWAMRAMQWKEAIGRTHS
ncbi:hypothetical protein [Paraburkholderia saeva]|uniref:Uncharacterized protein n=1 Tax=Paraburkholderia saeva TaxID=2777537 RepID=A0A9N8RT22_9BURK|nr:hypothetical protein [Paraburkholderia saeva]CAG4886183.1 hypothetical protein R70241_00137 [Paraburkholderia saeva]CAG4887424.1 hypothetical protein LMG31841_00431 [Paraburkholderia saeva]CAG4901678.1 hypothetical protein R52603_02880 [Paraburkholderia saeva]